MWHNFNFQKVFIIIIIYSDVKKNDYKNVSKVKVYTVLQTLWVIFSFFFLLLVFSRCEP